jgi:hypothetical protein
MKPTRNETRAEATHRLQREGRSVEATEYRREIRRQERAKGKTKAEAGEIAWAAMMEKFPPLDPERQPGKPGGPNQEWAAGLDSALAALRERAAGQPVDFPRDVAWVYQHLADGEVTPDDAPSTGSWSLLGWARNNRNHFFQHMFPKALAAQGKAKPHDEEEIAQTEGKSVEELTEVLRPFMDDVKVICPNCGADLNEATWKKHLEARKVAEQRSRERFGDD